MNMGMSLRAELQCVQQCKIIKGIPKRLLPQNQREFDAKLGQPVVVPLRRLLRLGDEDGRLVFTEVRRTSRSIYYSGYHPLYGSFEVRQAL